MLKLQSQVIKQEPNTSSQASGSSSGETTPGTSPRGPHYRGLAIPIKTDNEALLASRWIHSLWRFKHCNKTSKEVDPRNPYGWLRCSTKTMTERSSPNG
jgi:hypothetical protein